MRYIVGRADGSGASESRRVAPREGWIGGTGRRAGQTRHRSRLLDRTTPMSAETLGGAEQWALTFAESRAKPECDTKQNLLPDEL